MTFDELKNTLAHYHIHPKKILGQNFLMNEVVLEDMASSVPLETGDAILEIGPGIGNLTERLLQRDNFVLAIEKDQSLVPILKDLKKKYTSPPPSLSRRGIYPGFQYEIGDILKFNYQDALKNFPRYHVVANIPYYITGKIIQMLLAANHKPQTITLLVQKEVARNLAAKPGHLSVLALSVQLYGEAKVLAHVPARDFYPAPKVDSAVIQIRLYDKQKYRLENEKTFFGMLHACFAGKRKQIHNTLVNNLHVDKTNVEALLQKVGVSMKARPQELSLEQWIQLNRELESRIKN